MPITPMEVASAALVVSGLNYRTIREDLPPRRPTSQNCHSKDIEIQTEPEKRFLVSFTVENSGLAEVDIDAMTFHYYGYEAAITALDVVEGWIRSRPGSRVVRPTGS